jgi:hypothetical protein
MRNSLSAAALTSTVASAKESVSVLACLIWGDILAKERDASLHGATMGNAAAAAAATSDNDEAIPTVISPTEGVYFGIGTSTKDANGSDFKKIDVPSFDVDNDVLSCAASMFESSAQEVTSCKAAYSNTKKRPRDVTCYEHCVSPQKQQQFSR